MRNVLLNLAMLRIPYIPSSLYSFIITKFPLSVGYLLSYHKYITLLGQFGLTTLYSFCVKKMVLEAYNLDYYPWFYVRLVISNSNTSDSSKRKIRSKEGTRLQVCLSATSVVEICFLYLLHLMHFLWRNFADHEICLSDLYISIQKRKTTFFLPISRILWSFEYKVIFLIRFTISAIFLFFFNRIRAKNPLFLFCRKVLKLSYLTQQNHYSVSYLLDTMRDCKFSIPRGERGTKWNLSRKQVFNNVIQ